MCRLLFDGALARYLTLAQRSEQYSMLVENFTFEEAIRNVKRGDEYTLSGEKNTPYNIFGIFRKQKLLLYTKKIHHSGDVCLAFAIEERVRGLAENV